MKRPFIEELDFRKTRMGDLVLQRRHILSLGGREVYEVKLGDEYLMSSLFHESEVMLARLGLGALEGRAWDVVVGGLGLGYTAAAALDFEEVEHLVVVEAHDAVIDWHQRGLVPNGKRLDQDPRCAYRHADFFALARGDGYDPEVPGRRYDAILLDIDHTPDMVLDDAHRELYTEDGLRGLQRFLEPGGVFALWSNDAPEDAFLALLAKTFEHAEGHAIEFDNPLQHRTATNGVYLARRERASGS